ncbi:L-lactate dehydrogenase [Altererythrobacter arenosus]|uniref:L-lactate dehydrogenase n=1 Tax=Altererythrobacter arenosus TaxID=3032592 RepID=A0ABY8FY62_9SPHN|nr:L-lactate dehydrogenase [Altererythrobacter sp. CAU 1644]WFL78963.1 L-lactate dehydrogenase [Altererythrobacter sp. CAU 1644]
MPTLDLVPASVEDFRRRAEKRLPRSLFDYVDGGAGAEVTLRDNVEDFEKLRLRQRVMRDISDTSTKIELLGEELALPVILAPVGMAGMMARRAEVQAKRAADAMGIPFTLSTVGICPIDEVAAVSDKPAWYQLYMLRDRGVVQEILRRAWEYGVRTLVFTVDLSVVGTRYRDIRNGLGGGTSTWGKLRGGPIEYFSHPHWLWNVALRGGPLTFGNIAQYAPAARALTDFKEWVDSQFDPSVNWGDIAWLRDQWKGELIIKGILDPQDARDAKRIGADALVVSNHGGRQLDGVASGAAMLPRVADALHDDLPLIVDGGVRSGQDVVKALALGARAVMIGRPWIYAVAAQGEAGLLRLLTMFKLDMKTALGLSGYPHASQVDRGALLQDLGERA